jgi:hypothetical protein
MNALLDDPKPVVDALLADDSPVFGIIDAEVRLRTDRSVVIGLHLAPWPPCADAGFPNERVGIFATFERNALVVPPKADTRKWKHRNRGDMGDLCLWYPDDDPALVWRWEDGLESLITIAHRHLQYEEYWRRTGHWPVEDAPHGAGKHPVKSRLMRDAAKRWRR